MVKLHLNFSGSTIPKVLLMTNIVVKFQKLTSWFILFLLYSNILLPCIKLYVTRGYFKRYHISISWTPLPMKDFCWAPHRILQNHAMKEKESSSPKLELNLQTVLCGWLPTGIFMQDLCWAINYHTLPVSFLFIFFLFSFYFEDIFITHIGKCLHN
jgi:hypothetical protein